MERRWKTLLLSAAVLLALIGSSGIVAAAPAKNVTAKATFEAVCKEQAVDVKETFVLVPGAETPQVPLEVTLFADAKIENAKFTSGGKDLSFTSKPSEDGLRISYVVKPESPMPAAKEYTLTVEYRVSNGVKSEGFVEIPVAYVPWAPKAAVPGTFEGKITLPAGTYFVEGFPSEKGVQTAGQSSTVTYFMKLVPGFIKVEISSKAPGFFNTGRTIEAATIALVVLSAAGWLYFTPLRKR